MFATRRRSSSPTMKSVALVTSLVCCIVSVCLIENVKSMSLERLNSNESQMDYNEMLAREQELSENNNSVGQSDMMMDVSDDSNISVVPVKEGQSDVYLLVPAGGSHNPQTEDVLQSLADHEIPMDELSTSEGASDMLMLESEDTPSVQILEVPEDVMEQKLEAELQNLSESEKESVTEMSPVSEHEMKNMETIQTDMLNDSKSNKTKIDLSESEAVTESMADMLAETVEEIQKELEGEILDSDVGESTTEAVNSAEMPMEHKDFALQPAEEISATQNTEEEEMIGVVREQDSTEAPLELNEMKLELQENLQSDYMNDHEMVTEVVELPRTEETISSESQSQTQSQQSEQIEMAEKSKVKEEAEKTPEIIENNQEMPISNEANLMEENSAAEASADVEDLNPDVQSSEPANDDETSEDLGANPSAAQFSDESTAEVEIQRDEETNNEESTKSPFSDENMMQIEKAPENEEMTEPFEESSTVKNELTLNAEALALADHNSMNAGEYQSDEKIPMNEEAQHNFETETATEIESESLDNSGINLQESNAMSESNEKGQHVEESVTLQNLLDVTQPTNEEYQVPQLEIEEQQNEMAQVSHNSINSESSGDPQSMADAASQGIEELDFTTESGLLQEDSKPISLEVTDNMELNKQNEQIQSYEESQSTDNSHPHLEQEAVQNVDNMEAVETFKPLEDHHLEHEQFADDSQSFQDVHPSTETENLEESQTAEESHSPVQESKPLEPENIAEPESSGDPQSMQDAQPSEELPKEHDESQQSEEPQQSEELPKLEEQQDTEEKPQSGDIQSYEDAQSAPVEEISEPVEISQSPEESHAAEESETMQDLQSTHGIDAADTEQMQTAENSPSLEDSQSITASENMEIPAQPEQMQALEISQSQKENAGPPQEVLLAVPSHPTNSAEAAEELHTSEEHVQTLHNEHVQTLHDDTAHEQIQTLHDDAAGHLHDDTAHEISDSLPMSDEIEVGKQQTSSNQIEMIQFIPVITNDSQKPEESLSESLTDEEGSLQVNDILEALQPNDTSEQSVDNKDDPILNDDIGNNNNNNNNLLINQEATQQSNYESDKSQESSSSILTTILQVPTPPMQETEIQQQQQQQTLQTPVTTAKPLNVMDSVLNYVNASFMSQQPQQELQNEDEPFNSQLRRYDGAQVWRIVVQNDRERKLADELQSKYDGQLWKEVKQEVDYLLKPQVLADAERYVRAANLSRIVLIDNLQQVIEVENPPAEEIAQLQNRKGHRLTWQAYHRLEDIHGFFDYMAKTYPDICSVETIGYSIEKRPLKLLKISNGNRNNPGIWMDGGMHAREWIGVSVVTYIANQLVEGWDDLPSYMRSVNWYIHAVANPDGYEYTHTTDRLWRKNMRSHGRACPGVDLNRNFGYKWGGKGTSANPCSQTYRGSKAFSEPETFYISKFISNFPRDTFKGFLSFHSYGQYILYPWGYDYHITKDMADLDLVARQAGTSITRSSGVKYTVGSSAHTLYPAAGGSDDWAKGFADIKYSYTIEMGDTGRYGFVLPASHIEPNGRDGFTFAETVARAITMGKNSRRRKLVRKAN